MRYVTLKELVTLPPGTVFSTFAPCITEGLHVLVEPSAVLPDSDFWYADLVAHPDFNEPPDPAQGGNADHPLLVHADATQRWALYDPDEEFVVYEPADVERLVKLLTGRFKEVLGE